MENAEAANLKQNCSLSYFVSRLTVILVLFTLLVLQSLARFTMNGAGRMSHRNTAMNRADGRASLQGLFFRIVFDDLTITSFAHNAIQISRRGTSNHNGTGNIVKRE